MSSWTLNKLNFTPRKGPVLVVVMDGVGVAPPSEGNAVHLARTPVLDRLWAEHPTCELRAHGRAVGLPSDKDMGNSEVGHNAMGAGRVFAQGAKLVNEAIKTGAIFQGEAWTEMMASCLANHTPMHFIGLLSDGNVHSHIDQLFALIRRCHESGLGKVRVHPLLDGRDVPETSALIYLDQLEELLADINAQGDRDYRIASGGGRMLVTMDRYEANWSVVERGWRAHVLGEGRPFKSAREGIETYRAEDPGLIDQFTPEFVIVDEQGAPVGPIQDGDGVVFFNFRGDRGIEISRAFDAEGDFPYFDRVRVPACKYAGLMQYDGDLLIPRSFLVEPPEMDHTLGEYLAKNRVAQFACAETPKFGHVTYFWNGNRGGKFDDELETYVEITSDLVPFEQRPWMKAAEVTDATIEALESGRFPFARINYANGDMVGHTGSLEAAVLAVQTVDLCLGRLLKAVARLGGVALITADHGNADEMLERDKKTGEVKRKADGTPSAKTSHTLAPVPFTLYDPGFAGDYELDPSLETRGLSNIAATVLNLLGYEAPEGYDPSLIRLK